MANTTTFGQLEFASALQHDDILPMQRGTTPGQCFRFTPDVLVSYLQTVFGGSIEAGANIVVTGTGTIDDPYIIAMPTIPALSGEVSSTGNAVTLLNAAVIGKLLTGFAASPGTITATDSILTAIEKLVGNAAQPVYPVVTHCTGTASQPDQRLASDTGGWFSNEGATQKNYQNLADLSGGSVSTRQSFLVQAAVGMRLIVPNNMTFLLGNDLIPGGGYIDSTDVGSSMQILGLNPTTYIATSTTGFWTPSS